MLSVQKCPVPVPAPLPGLPFPSVAPLLTGEMADGLKNLEAGRDATWTPAWGLCTGWSISAAAAGS